MTTLPGLSTHRSALFLDFDGTLADLAGRPDAVVVPPDLAALLDALHRRLGGAFALVTGRSRADLLGLLPAADWPAAFEHGAVRRSAHGIVIGSNADDLSAAITAAQALAAGFTEVQVCDASVVQKPHGQYPVFLLTGRRSAAAAG